ncbi:MULTISPECIES: MarR family winged helix-turn-helix transcriptional regulator [Marinobacter]|uniref:MarR family transcriptional regulator n=1 Tax=Marinobacter metalliresistant TaxID=2961995 RepID=A0ABZ2W2S2_9GAMM|nr:MarR family transcriptional regulator [Marinobacter sp. Arc7-DN-1]AXS81853.1 MarR family transcriptional regulator [Marinobacter sp. Arc7-DN-1]
MAASDQRLYFLLQLAAHRLKKRADAALADAADLSTAQAAALSIIANRGPVSQRFVADQLAQRESAVMTMTNRLLRADYITKSRSETDARVWELSVTDRGLKALDKMQEPFSAINGLIDSRLGADEVDRLAAGLKKLLKALDV